MQLVRAGIPESRPILDQICPGKAPQDRMGAVATYLAQHIKVKIKQNLKFSVKVGPLILYTVYGPLF